LGSGRWRYRDTSGPGTNQNINPTRADREGCFANDWPFDRTSDREIAVEVAGRWCRLPHVLLLARDDVEALHFTCAYDVRIRASAIPTFTACWR